MISSVDRIGIYEYLLKRRGLHKKDLKICTLLWLSQKHEKKPIGQPFTSENKLLYAFFLVTNETAMQLDFGIDLMGHLLILEKKLFYRCKINSKEIDNSILMKEKLLYLT